MVKRFPNLHSAHVLATLELLTLHRIWSYSCPQKASARERVCKTDIRWSTSCYITSSFHLLQFGTGMMAKMKRCHTMSCVGHQSTRCTLVSIEISVQSNTGQLDQIKEWLIRSAPWVSHFPSWSWGLFGGLSFSKTDLDSVGASFSKMALFFIMVDWFLKKVTLLDTTTITTTNKRIKLGSGNRYEMLSGTLLSLLILCEQTCLKQIIQPCHDGVQTIYMP